MGKGVDEARALRKRAIDGAASGRRGILGESVA